MCHLRIFRILTPMIAVLTTLRLSFRLHLLLLMFVGGCAGSTGGGIKVIRHILFYKILRLEIEKAHRPRVVRFIRISGSAIDDPNLPHSIVVYFSMILAIFVFSWLLRVPLAAPKKTAMQRIFTRNDVLLFFLFTILFVTHA